MNALLAQKDELRLDGCAVFSPHVEHFGNALPCLESGLHVLVEKPLTVSTAERSAASDARALAAAADAAGVSLLVNTPMNYGNACERACELVAAGRIGNIEHIACHMEGPLRDLMAGEPMEETADQVYRPPASTWADPSRAGGCKLVTLSRSVALSFSLTLKGSLLQMGPRSVLRGEQLAAARDTIRGGLIPDSGHLIHMASHIDVQLGE